MEKKYLKLASATGWLFEERKTAAEGFEQHDYVPKSGENKDKTITTFRKYYKFGIFGKFIGVKPEEFEKVWYLKICFEHDVEGVTYIVNFPIYDPKKNINSFAAAFISYLPGLVLGTAYKFNPYVDDREARKKYGISMLFAQLSDNAVDDKHKPTRLSLEYTKKNPAGGYETVPGDIPMTDWKQVADENDLSSDSPVLKNVPDNTRKNAYLTKVLKEHKKGEIPNGGSQGATFDSTQAPKPTGAVQTPPAQAPAQNTSQPGISPNASFDSTANTTAAAPSAPNTTIQETIEDDDLPF